jgi:hypothetical protein
MILRKGQIYRCQNPECRAEIEVVKDSIEAVSNPLCCCGSEMKKAYARPVFRTLDRNAPEVKALFGNRE